MDQPLVQPGRAVRSDLNVQIDRGKNADAGLPVSADQIIGDAPLVNVDPLDDSGPAQRL